MPTITLDPSTTQIAKACPKCESTEAWHGCITEDGSTKYACDECGMWLTLKVTQPAPPKVRRPFKFSFAIENGALFIETGRHSIVSFKPGRWLAIGDTWELLSGTEAERREQQATTIGKLVGREQAEKAAAAELAS